MDAPHNSLSRQYLQHSRSRRHQKRDREREQKSRRELFRPSPASDADGNKQSLIQGWLEGLPAARQGETAPYEHRARPSYDPHSSPTRKAASQCRPEHDGQRSKRRRHNRHSLGDTQVVASQTLLDDTTGYADGFQNRSPRQQQDASANLPSSGASSEIVQFHKRPRRRTRADRYKVTKEDHATKEKQRKRPSERPDNSKKAQDTLTSAREVIEKFSSASILNERITVGTRPIAPVLRHTILIWVAIDAATSGARLV